MSNELGRLSRGNDPGVKTNNCIDFIHNRDVKNYINVTYAKFVYNYQHLKSDQYIISLLLRGEKLDYALNAG